MTRKHGGKECAMFGAIVDGRANTPWFAEAWIRRVISAQPRPAVHRTILVADVQGFSVRERNNRHRVEVRKGLHHALRSAFQEANIRWTACRREYCGDAIFVLAPPSIPKGLFVESLPPALTRALGRHNDTHVAEEQIQLRMALHAGEVAYDEHGVAGAAINLAFRLADAQPLKAALAAAPGDLALIVSTWFYDEVVRHAYTATGSPGLYEPVRITVKETRTVGWINLPMDD